MAREGPSLPILLRLGQWNGTESTERRDNVLQLHKEVQLPVDIEQAFAWHQRIGAFERLCPPWQRLEVIEPAPSLDNGTRLIFRMFQGPVPLRWVAEHRDVDPPHQFRDIMAEGPFASWSHRHAFRPDPDTDGSILSDELEFSLPLAAASETVAGWKLRQDLERVFAYRHRLTQGDLEVHGRYADRPRLDIVVSGSGGLIGKALCAFLSTGGHRVRRLVRRPAQRDRPGYLDEIQWDPQQGILEPEQMEGVDAVIALGGENIADGRWTAERKKRLIDSRVQAVDVLVESLSQLEEPPPTLISASGIGYFGNSGDVELDEDGPKGKGFLADLVEAWEGAVAKAEDHGIRAVSLRFGAVLSPQGGALAKMLPPFLAGVGGPLGSGRPYMPWVSIDDAVGAAHHALMHDDVRGPVNVVAPGAVRQKDFSCTLGKVLRRPAVLPAPAFALRLLFGEMADEMLLSGTRAVPAKLTDTGYRFRQGDLETALRHVLGR